MYKYGNPSGSSKFGEWLRINTMVFSHDHYYFSQRSNILEANEVVQVTELDVDQSYEMQDM